MSSETNGSGGPVEDVQAPAPGPVESAPVCRGCAAKLDVEPGIGSIECPFCGVMNIIGASPEPGAGPAAEPGEQIHETSQRDIVCRGCAGKLEFAPGTNSLKCPYCGTMNEIQVSSEAVEELDYDSFLKEAADQSAVQEVANIKCRACGAQTTMPPGVVSGECPFCGTPQVVKDASLNKLFRPRAVIPFLVDLDKAYGGFRKWIGKLWFAPNKLKHSASQDRFTGLYLPYWTYDADTATDYRGKRGDDYQEQESYTTVENGRSVRKTRTVTRTRWSNRSGHVDGTFDDVLVAASKSLPSKHLTRLEPWDLGRLVPFSESYLSGFRTESYQVDLKEGFSLAKKIIDREVEGAVRRDIGGDRQVIDALKTIYSRISFKHILLPVWISAYRYNGKVYRFLVNGCTGEVQGERPYSWVKITFFVLALAAVIAVILMLTGKG